MGHHLPTEMLPPFFFHPHLLSKPRNQEVLVHSLKKKRWHCKVTPTKCQSCFFAFFPQLLTRPQRVIIFHLKELLESELVLHDSHECISDNDPIPDAMSVCISWHGRLRRCSCRKGRGLSDLWLMHSSSSCQANITLSGVSMWHSVTMRGCDRTSPFPLRSPRAICDIASLVLGSAVYFTYLPTENSYSWLFQSVE